MAREQDVVKLPFKLTEFTEDIIPLLNRNFAEIERMLSLLQGYVKQSTGGAVKDLPTKAGVWDRASNINPDGTFPTNLLQGVIETLQNQVNAGGDTVTITDNDGILIVDDPANPTQALKLSGGIFAISNQKDGQGNWIWRTFGTGDGFVADEIISGKILTSLITIMGEGGFTRLVADGLRVYDSNWNPKVHVGYYESYGTQTAAFDRPSTAYLSDGTQVAADQPRFEAGKFGSAIVVEEGTTNLMPSGVAQGTSGIVNYWNGVIDLGNTEKSWIGGSSCKVTPVAGNSKKDGFIAWSGQALIAGTTITGSLMVWIPAGNKVRFGYRGVKVVGGLFENWLIEVTGIGAWQRVEIPVYTLVEDMNNFGIQGYEWPADSLGGNAFWIDALQLEQKPYATTFTDGTRSAETLTIPTAGVLDPQKGTVECWVYLDGDITITTPSTWRTLFSLSASGTAANTLYFQRSVEADTWRIRSGDSTGYTEDLFTWTPAVGWHYFVLRWSVTELAAFIDGVKYGSVLNPKLPDSLPTNAYVGSWVSGIQQINTLIDDLRISSRARTDQEILDAYNSGAPLPVDEYTTYKMSFDNTLQPTVKQDYGLIARGGKIEADVIVTGRYADAGGSINYGLPGTLPSTFTVDISAGGFKTTPVIMAQRGENTGQALTYLSATATEVVFDAALLVNQVFSSFNSPGGGPSGLTYDGTYLWNTDFVADTIYKLNTTGTIISSFSSPGGGPTGLTYDGTYLWNADSGLDTIYKLNTIGTIISSFSSPSGLSQDLAYDGTYLWNADNGVDTIYKLNTTGTIISSFSSPGGDPTGLTYDGTYLWNADDGAGVDTIYKLNTTGTIISSFSSPGGDPTGLTYDGTYLWNADLYQATIYKIGDKNDTRYALIAVRIGIG